jgi:hypothetical protein
MDMRGNLLEFLLHRPLRSRTGERSASGSRREDPRPEVASAPQQRQRAPRAALKLRAAARAPIRRRPPCPSAGSTVPEAGASTHAQKAGATRASSRRSLPSARDGRGPGVRPVHAHGRPEAAAGGRPACGRVVAAALLVGTRKGSAEPRASLERPQACPRHGGSRRPASVRCVARARARAHLKRWRRRPRDDEKQQADVARRAALR